MTGRQAASTPLEMWKRVETSASIPDSLPVGKAWRELTPTVRHRITGRRDHMKPELANRLPFEVLLSCPFASTGFVDQEISAFANIVDDDCAGDLPNSPVKETWTGNVRAPLPPGLKGLPVEDITSENEVLRVIVIRVTTAQAIMTSLKRLQACQRRRKKRRMHEMEQDQEMELNEKPTSSTITITDDNNDCIAMDVDEVTDADCNSVSVHAEQNLVLSSHPHSSTLQPPVSFQPWSPFSSFFTLNPSWFQNSRYSHGRFNGKSLLGRILKDKDNSMENAGSMGSKLLQSVILEVAVHTNPGTADGTNPNLPVTLQELIRTQALTELQAMFQLISEFHGKIHSLSALVKSTTIKHLPRAKLDKTRKFPSGRKSVQHKLSNGNIPHGVVVTVICDICLASCAFQILGSRRNRRQFAKFVKRLLLSGCRSTLHLNLLLEVLDVDACSWMNGIPDPSLRRHIFAKVMFWLVCDYIFSILQLGYYVTQTEATRFQLNFYLQDTWRSVSSIVKTRYTKAGWLKPASGTGNAASANVPTSKFRFLPKTDDLRPIIEALPTSKSSKYDLSQFNLLLHYLAMEVAPHATGSGSDLYLRNAWRKFWTELQEMPDMEPQIFYIKMDIQNAYPSVNMKKLQEILQELVGRKKYTAKMMTDHRGLKRIPILFSNDETDETAKLADMHRKSKLFEVKNVVAKPFPAEIVLKQILDVITSKTTVKINRKFYDFSRGLPQGSPISPILCRIYYGYMEKLYLPDFGVKGTRGEMFCRCADDYIFVSTDVERVEELYDRLKGGIPEYNFQLKVSKIVGSIFESDTGCNWFTCCGWRFNLINGHVVRDFGSYEGIDPCSTLSFKMRDVSAEKFIVDRLMYLKSLRLGHGMMDPWLNCKLQIAKSLFDAALFASFRFFACCRVLYPSITCLEDEQRAAILSDGIQTFAKRLFQFVKHFRFRPSEELICKCYKEFPNLHPSGLGPFKKSEIRYIVIKAFLLKMRLQANANSKRCASKGLQRRLEYFENSLETWLSRRFWFHYLRTLVDNGIPGYLLAMK